MTKPTQAQIEAAMALQDIRQLIRDFEDVPDPTDKDGQDVFNRARLAVDKLATLTAAAEAGEGTPKGNWPTDDELIADLVASAIEEDGCTTAAAEVAKTDLWRGTLASDRGYSEPQGTGFQAGEAEPTAAEVGCDIKDPPCTFDEGYKYKEAECKDEIAYTIERCAQVAENTPCLGYGKEPGEIIAAEIRALKEQSK